MSETQVLDEELSALVDGELDPGRAAELRARAARSPELAARLDALRRVDAALRAVPEPAVPGDLLGRVHAAARAQAPRRVAPRSRRRRLFLAGGALAAAAAGLAIWLAPGVETGAPGTAPPVDLTSASDEEIGLALELETLEDFEVIEYLDLLEGLDPADREGRG